MTRADQKQRKRCLCPAWVVFLGLLPLACQEPKVEQVAQVSAPLEQAASKLEEHQWDEAIELARFALDEDPEDEEAQSILDRASEEKSNQLRFESARALLRHRHYLRAFARLLSMTAPSIYENRADRLSMSLRQDVALAERIVRRPDQMVMVRFSLVTTRLGSTEKQAKRAHKQCEEYLGECQKKWFTREVPRHVVSLSPYYIDQYEVSVAQYKACVDAQACPVVSWAECGLKDGDARAPYLDESLPQVCVSWDEAQNYCSWVGGQLPSEAQWERAARRSNDIYPWGDTFNPTAANWSDKDGSDGIALLAPVDHFGPHANLLYNAAGNAYEWVADWYAEDSHQHAKRYDPQGPQEGIERVIKGGAFTRNPSSLRVAHRNKMPPEFRDKSVGFRCARSAESVF